MFWVSRVLYSQRQSILQIKWFLQLGSIYSWNLYWKRNKAVKWFLKDVIYLLKTFETFETLETIDFAENLEMGHIVEGEGSYYLCHDDALPTKIDI